MLILDAGAFIAAERGEDDVAALVRRERRHGRVPLTNGGVVAQVWRGGNGKQVPVARLLASVDTETTSLPPTQPTCGLWRARRVSTWTSSRSEHGPPSQSRRGPPPTTRRPPAAGSWRNESGLPQLRWPTAGRVWLHWTDDAARIACRFLRCPPARRGASACHSRPKSAASSPVRMSSSRCSRVVLM